MPQLKKKQQPKDTSNITVLKTTSSPKLNPQTQSKLEYQIGKQDDTNLFFIRISENESGGHYSNEWISFENIEQCFGPKFDRKQAFSSSILRSAFQHGGSANNAGFLAAVLRNEMLLTPHDKNVFQHLLTGSFDKWKESVKKLIPSTSSPAP
jgi:hypothetical protein